MDKLLDKFKKLWEWFKGLGKRLKIVLIIGIISTLIAIVTFVTMSMSTKYAVLFSNLDPNDAQTVTAKLKEQKVDMKIEGQTILVPKEKVDSLRLEIAPELTDGSKGYELMDEASSFGMTDEEFKIRKLRMQQGELEKTIKSFPQVENARVHITPAKDSVFVKDKEPGKAAITLKIAPGQKLEINQVKAIVALVSGSTENIPKENIEVIDDKMNLLTQNINGDGDTVNNSSQSVSNQQKLELDYENKLKNEVTKLLEPVLGKGKAQVAVNVDLDFDSKKKTETIIDPNKVIVSQQTNKEENTQNGGTTSQSPIDNNMSNTIGNTNGSVTSSKEENTTNYESGKSETTTISAPGEVRRMTTSVFVDGNLDQGTQQMLQEAIGAAIGLNIERGDKISVQGMAFDPVAKDEAKQEIDALNEAIQKENIIRWIKMGVTSLVLLIVLIILILIIRKKRNNKGDERALDVIIDNSKEVKAPKTFAPIDFEVNNEKQHIENEIKKYAKDKPEQVVDIIKSWLTENER